MCYFNGIKIVKSHFVSLLDLKKVVADFDCLVMPFESGFDYKEYPVLKPAAGKKDFDIVKMEWGFIPHYIRDRKALNLFRRGGVDAATGKYNGPVTTLNAIGEELLDKTTYRQAALSRRCLVPSSGFVEWRHIYPLSKKTGKPVATAVKYPYHVTLPGQEYFYMAAIWTPWTDKESGEYVESFSIVTTRANMLMEQVHNAKKRMPCILTEQLAYEWMFGELNEEMITSIAATQHPAELMQAIAIDKEFKQLENPFQPVNYPELPPLGSDAPVAAPVVQASLF